MIKFIIIIFFILLNSNNTHANENFEEWKINFYKYTFRGLNIGPILKNDFDKNLTNFSSFLGLLNYRFFKQVSIRIGLESHR